MKHSEILAYAIEFINEKYKKDTERIKLAQQAGLADLEDLLELNNIWKSKLSVLCDLYEIETGSKHPCEPE